MPDSTLLNRFGRNIPAASLGALIPQASGADVTAPAALTTDAIVAATAATVATANGSDPATTQALANALKTALNAVIADNVETREVMTELLADVTALRTKLAAAITAHNALKAELVTAGILT